jgi:hypothetical protein
MMETLLYIRLKWGKLEKHLMTCVDGNLEESFVLTAGMPKKGHRELWTHGAS